MICNIRIDKDIGKCKCKYLFRVFVNDYEFNIFSDWVSWFLNLLIWVLLKKRICCCYILFIFDLFRNVENML